MASTRPARLAAALLSLTVSTDAFFTFSSVPVLRHDGSTPMVSTRSAGRQAGSLALACQSEMSRMEVKAVERMTKEFDKLCKTCPTRLQPRADNAAAMLLALPEEERKEALQRVESVLSGAAVAPIAAEDTCGVSMSAPGVAVPVTGLSEKETIKAMEKEEMKVKMKMKGNGEKMKGGEKERMKALEKEDKNKRELELSRALLALVDSLETGAEMPPLEQGSTGRFGPICAKTAGMIAKEVGKQRMELSEMPAARRAVRRLKYLEKQAKCERKLAECRMKLAELSACGEEVAAGPVVEKVA